MDVFIIYAVFLGVSFLASVVGAICGIGGGPINLVILYFFFSMTTKAAAANSLYIILFSQATSLVSTIVTGTVPAVNWGILAGMIICGILGGMAGRVFNRKMDEKMVDKLFMVLMIVIILINIYNVFRALGASDACPAPTAAEQRRESAIAGRGCGIMRSNFNLTSTSY